MPTAQKRTISAKQILADIRAGMDENSIKAKYRLSDNSYKKVLQKLASVKAVEPSSEEKKIRGGNDRAPRPELPPKMTWHCPACRTPQPREYDECPQCGVITAKYTTLRNDDYRLSQTPIDTGVATDKSVGNKVVVIAVSIVIFIGLGAAFLKFTATAESNPALQAMNTAVENVQSSGTTNFEDEALRVTENTGSKPTSVKISFAPGVVQTFTTSIFKDQVVPASGSLPVLVEFYTEKCPACKMMEPVLTNLAKDMGAKAIIGKVGPRERELFSAFSITGVPTMFILRDGEIRETFVGTRPKEMLAEALGSYASNSAQSQ